MQLSNIRRFFLVEAFSYVYFWIAIAIPYLLFRQFEFAEAFALLGIYAIFNVILEYPTGVFADHYGSKKAIFISNLLMFAGTLLLAQNGPKFIYYIAVLITGVGNSLNSGSDISLLKMISKDFKKDLSNYKSMADLILFIVSATGAIIAAKFGFEFALYLNAFIFLIAALTALTIKSPKANEDSNIKGNIFSTAFHGFKVIKSNAKLQILIFFSFIIGAYGLSVKTLLGSTVKIFSIDLELVGLFVGLSMLSRSFGTKLTARADKINTNIITIAFILTLLLSILPISAYFSIGMVIIANFFLGIMLTRSDYEISQEVNDKVRASIISFRNLFSRLMSSLYLGMSGLILSNLNFNYLILFTVSIFIICLLSYNLRLVFIKRSIAL